MTYDTMQEQLVRSPRMGLYKEWMDRFLAEEAERRRAFYDQLDESTKAEFINGEVIVHSPATWDHIQVTGRILNLLDIFVRKHQLGHVAVEKALVALTRNDYEPDVCFWPRDVSARFQGRQRKFPAPALAVEVLSESTEARDRGVKFDDYAAHGVAEYWIVDPQRNTVEQFVLQDGRYELAIKADTGEITSRAVTGFTIPVRAIFDEAHNLATLARLLNA